MPNKKKPKIGASLLLCLLLLSLSVLPSFAEDYNGDTLNDGIVTRSTSGASLTETQVRLSSTCIYDAASEVFIFNEEGYTSTEVASTVYKGEITTGKVYVSIGSGIMAEIYRDGEEVNEADSGDFVFADTGSYVIRNKNTDKELLAFTIVNSVTGDIYNYTIPDVYYIGRLSFNGEDQPSLGVSTLDLTEEGEYEIVLKSSFVSHTSELFITVDHTEPELTLSGLTDNYARGPVSMGEPEYGGHVEVYREGEWTENLYEETTFTEKGTYHLISYDEAGNYRTYDFTIRTYLDLKAWVVVAILLACLAVIGGFMLRCRKHMRTY